jgi:L-fuculose-phosphate aldolase
MRQDLKDLVLEIARLIWERRLSDTAGGNISIRDGDAVCITPRLMGYRLRWQITADDLSIVTPGGEVLEGPEQITREGRMHLGLYQEFSDAGAIIHAHPYWTTVFVARAECVPEAHGYSEQLAENVISHFASKRGQWEKTPLMTILPRHGIVAMGKDMNACFDIVDRIETDCRCQILGKLLDR